MHTRSAEVIAQRRQTRIVWVAGLCALIATGAAGAAEPRSLSLVHTHSGEQVTCRYAGGSDDAGCRAQFGHLLRDWRNDDSHAIDPALFDLLYDLQRLAGGDAPFEVISAYRSPATNELLRSRSSGVSEKSLHMQGRALDVRLRGFPTAKLGALARGMRRGGSSYYPESDFVHVDTGRVRTW
jgi:uncharacterized protein YcbK (DUF882 family)